MFPTEFVEAFESQYPKPELVYELPESLDKCPTLKDLIVRNIKNYHELKLIIMDDNHVSYNMIDRTYTTLADPKVTHSMSNRGYELMFEKLYSLHGGNLSPKSFSFILEDLVALNPVRFRANLITCQQEYIIRKGIDINKAWQDYCSKYQTDFKMDYSEYEKAIGIHTETSD